MAHATARDSSLIATYPFWVSVRALLAKYTGLPFCSKHVPSPLMLASVCRAALYWSHNMLKISAFTSSFLITLKASLCLGPQLNGTLSLDNSQMGSDSSDNLAENLDR